MKKMMLILMLISTLSFAQDTTSTLKPTDQYIVLSNQNIGKKNSKAFDFWAPDSNGSFSPKKAILFSMITPGLGHLYVRKPIKGLLYFAAEAYVVQQSIYFHQQYINDVKPNISLLKDKIGEEAWYAMGSGDRTQMLRDSTYYDLNKGYWRPKEQRNKRLWWCAGVYIMAMLDCYVDAHLSDFPKGDLEFINDTQTKSNGIKFSIPIEGIKND